MPETLDTDTLRLQNARRMQALHQAGMILDPIMILKTRLDMMSDILFKALGLNEDIIENDWELLISSLLDSAESEIQQNGEPNEDTE